MEPSTKPLNRLKPPQALKFASKGDLGDQAVGNVRTGKALVVRRRWNAS